MAGKNGFDSISLSPEELEAKIRAHRISYAKKIGIALGVIIVIAIVIKIWLDNRIYTDYEVRNSIEQTDKSAARFAELDGNILEYSNDGVVCKDSAGKLLWNCGFEMVTPQIDVCKEYMIAYDKGGNKLYIITNEGLEGEIETPSIIRTACVAKQGTVAVLLEKENNYNVKVYDKSGKELAAGAFYGAQGSVPVDIAFSYDGKKLAVDLINFSGGKVDTLISFYNFGDVGQSEINNNVGSYTYEDTLIPQIEYVSENEMIAIGGDSLRIFTGAQKPELSEEVEFEKEIQSFFYNEKNAAIIYANNDEKGTYHMEVYNLRGKKVMEQDFDLKYENAEFLSNGEVCISNKYECELYTMSGIKKFEYTFDKEVYKILHDEGVSNYIFITNGATEEVRLK